MSLAELLPAIHELDRQEKVILVQELVAELAQEEGIPTGKYQIWSQFDAHDGAHALLQALDEENHNRIATRTYGKLLMVGDLTITLKLLQLAVVSNKFRTKLLSPNGLVFG